MSLQVRFSLNTWSRAWARQTRKCATFTRKLGLTSSQQSCRHTESHVSHPLIHALRHASNLCAVTCTTSCTTICRRFMALGSVVTLPMLTLSDSLHYTCIVALYVLHCTAYLHCTAMHCIPVKGSIIHGTRCICNLGACVSLWGYFYRCVIV